MGHCFLAFLEAIPQEFGLVQMTTFQQLGRPKSVHEISSSERHHRSAAKYSQVSEPFILRSGENLHRAKLQSGNHVLDGIRFRAGRPPLPSLPCPASSV